MQRIAFISALLLSFVLGCTQSRFGGGRTEFGYTSLVTYNERDDAINIEEFWLDDDRTHNRAMGWHSPGIEKSWSPIALPYPRTAEFHYLTTGTGQWHRQRSVIDPPIPPDFDGRIYFRFRPDNTIKVSLVSWKDWDRDTDGPLHWREE